MPGKHIIWLRVELRKHVAVELLLWHIRQQHELLDSIWHAAGKFTETLCAARNASRTIEHGDDARALGGGQLVHRGAPPRLGKAARCARSFALPS